MVADDPRRNSRRSIGLRSCPLPGQVVDTLVAIGTLLEIPARPF
jgi:hypothetical protein